MRVEVEVEVEVGVFCGPQRVARFRSRAREREGERAPCYIGLGCLTPIILPVLEKSQQNGSLVGYALIRSIVQEFDERPILLRFEVLDGTGLSWNHDKSVTSAKNATGASIPPLHRLHFGFYSPSPWGRDVSRQGSISAGVLQPKMVRIHE